MTDRLFIGTAEKRPAGERFRDAQEFEEFHNGLLSVPDGVVAANLGRHMMSLASAYLITSRVDSLYIVNRETSTAVGVPSHSNDYIQGRALRLAATAIAQDNFDQATGASRHTPFHVGWLHVVRDSITKAAQIHGVSEIALERSPFFGSQHLRLMLALGQQAYSRFEPYGEYDQYAFAAGVATGQIRLRTPQ